MKISTALTALVLGTLVTTGAARAEPGNPKVALFAQDAALSNEYEIAESKIILEDSQNPQLRAFAQEMIRDHGKAQRMLMQAGAMAGTPTSLVFDTGRKADVDDLGLMEGAKLDAKFTADQVAAHASSAAALSGYAVTGTNPALRAYARMTLPVVLRHQRMLEAITGQPAPL